MPQHFVLFTALLPRPTFRRHQHKNFTRSQAISLRRGETTQRETISPALIPPPPPTAASKSLGTLGKFPRKTGLVFFWTGYDIITLPVRTSKAADPEWGLGLGVLIQGLQPPPFSTGLLKRTWPSKDKKSKSMPKDASFTLKVCSLPDCPLLF